MKEPLIFFPFRFISFLLLVMAGILGTLMAVEGHASIPRNSDWDDAMFSSLYFQEVPSIIQEESGQRFIWNQNRIKRAFILNHR